MPLLIDDLVLTFFRRRCLCRSRLGNLIHVALTWEKMGVPGLNEKPALSSQNGKVHCCNGLRTTSVLEETICVRCVPTRDPWNFGPANLDAPTRRQQSRQTIYFVYSSTLGRILMSHPFTGATSIMPVSAPRKTLYERLRDSTLENHCTCTLRLAPFSVTFPGGA